MNVRTIVTGAAISDVLSASSRQAPHGSAVSSPEIDGGCARQGGRGPGPRFPLRHRNP